MIIFQGVAKCSNTQNVTFVHFAEILIFKTSILVSSKWKLSLQSDVD